MKATSIVHAINVHTPLVKTLQRVTDAAAMVHKAQHTSAVTPAMWENLHTVTNIARGVLILARVKP